MGWVALRELTRAGSFLRGLPLRAVIVGLLPAGRSSSAALLLVAPPLFTCRGSHRAGGTCFRRPGAFVRQQRSSRYLLHRAEIAAGGNHPASSSPPRPTSPLPDYLRTDSMPKSRRPAARPKATRASPSLPRSSQSPARFNPPPPRFSYPPHDSVRRQLRRRPCTLPLRFSPLAVARPSGRRRDASPRQTACSVRRALGVAASGRTHGFFSGEKKI
ncbi:hypothetical protein BRADI_4g23763v3 [Brachypodium distachyon]|uniref:Uncharacterized protein n=1 Tax=Brachypodium distachyon TaxID=15368 RepID=A0A0Q3H6W6_BRADI|nr:hypothetical protein BRADI_4g23763v3 [Brachypodium distachyon]